MRICIFKLRCQKADHDGHKDIMVDINSAFLRYYLRSSLSELEAVMLSDCYLTNGLIYGHIGS